jgi:fructose-bisphosphate aldolase class II
MLTPTQHLLNQAMHHDPPYGVLALNVIGLEHAEAIVAAAEAEQSPVILQISQNAIRYRGALEPLGRACHELAQAATVPVALHLDHATTDDLCERAANLGFSSIMFDASAATEDDNIRLTAQKVKWAHQRDVTIEGELGIVGGKDGIVTSVQGLTDPASASHYADATGIDALAVAIGTEHGMTQRRATLDLARLDRIRRAVAVPLVLHGSSGVPDEILAEAVRRGITKVNLATQLNSAYTAAVRECLSQDRAVVDPRIYGAAGRTAMMQLVRDRCRLVGSSGHT